MNNNKYTKIYFDGDIILNKASFALERRKYEVLYKGRHMCYTEYKKDAEKYIKVSGYGLYDNVEIELHRWTEREELLGNLIDNLIRRTCKDLNCENYLIMVGPENSRETFRHKIAVTVPYKGNRKPGGRPLLYDKAREYLLANHKCVVAESIYEADDILGIYLTKRPIDTIVASIDKDLLQIPGWHYDLNTKEVIQSTDPGKLWITRRKDGARLDLKGTGFKWFCAQMLLGDSVDNIQKPLKGFGPRKVYKYFKDVKTKEQLWSKVLTFYKKHASIERLEENATLLWIQRHLDTQYKDYLNDI